MKIRSIRWRSLAKTQKHKHPCCWCNPETQEKQHAETSATVTVSHQRRSWSITTFLVAPFTSHLTCDFWFCKFTATNINHKSQKAHLPLLYTVFCLTFAFIIFSFSSLSLKDEALWSFVVQQVSLLLRINPTPALEMRQCVKSANAPGTLCEMRWGPLGGGSSVGHARERW